MLARCRRFISPRLTCPFTALPLSHAAVAYTISTTPSAALALSFFLWCARQPHYFHSPHAFDLILPAVLRLGPLPSLLAALRSTGCPPKPQTLLLLLRIYWRANLPIPALQVFDEMKSQHFVPNTFTRNIIIDILFKNGCHSDALAFFSNTHSPNFLTFNIVLRNLCMSGDSSSVCYIFREMINKRFYPNAGTFAVVFDCFRRKQLTRLQLQLLGFMLVLGERGSVAVWTMLIDSLCQAGMIDLGVRMLGNTVPNVVTYTTLIKALAKAGLHEEVGEVFSTMLSKGCAPDLVLYNVLIDCMTKAGRFNDAVEAFVDLRRRGIEPDAYTLSSLMSLLCESGKVRLLPRLLAGLDVTFDLVACNSLLSYLCKAGLPSQAVELYREMIYKGITPDKYSVVGLLNGLCQLGMTNRAVNLYRSFASGCREIDPHVHSTILNGLVKRGLYHGAIGLFREAVSRNYNLDVVSYTIAIHGFFQCCSVDNAKDLFDRMKQSGVVPNICTYNVMLRGLCRARDFSAVHQLVDDMGIAGVEMDCISYNTVIQQMLKMRRVRQGILLFMRMCDLELKPSRKTHLRILDVLVHVHDGEADDLLPQLTYYLEDPSIVGSDAFDRPDKLPWCVGG